MIPDSRRLKRGLKDISPLFGLEAEEKNVKTPALREEKRKLPRIIHVCSPEAHQDSLKFNSFFAGQMKDLNRESVIISLEEKRNTAKGSRGEGPLPVKRFVLQEAQLDAFCKAGPQALKDSNGGVLFIDFNRENPTHLKKVLPLLDQLVLLLSPDLESLSEGYKLIKAARSVNPKLEYFLAYHGPENSQKSALLFERFSEIVSRRLGAGVAWIGEWDSRTPSQTDRLGLESLELPAIVESLEKRSLTDQLFSDRFSL